MNLEYKKILYIDINKLEYEFKVHEDLWKYVGGVGVGYRLLFDNFDESPIIITCGPLSGYFPYVSKCNLLYLKNGRFVEKYGGGTIASSMNFLGIDGIVIFGKTDNFINVSIYDQEVTFLTEDKREFSKRNFDMTITGNSVTSRGYFSFGNINEHQIDINGGISLNIDATRSLDLKNFYDYENIYNSFLERYRELTVEPRNNPSCFGCPMGCDNSSAGEDGLNIAVLPRTLISCGYAEDIFKDIPNVYAALNSVGYRYHHSHLENLPGLVGQLKTSISELLSKNIETK